MRRLLQYLALLVCVFVLGACSQNTAINTVEAEKVYAPEPGHWAEEGPKYLVDGRIISAEEKKALEKAKKSQ